MALNGTIFNSNTTGYRHLPGVPLPKKMPYYDKNVSSTWQLFISTFLLEHMTRTLFDEAPFEFLIPWDMIGEPYLLTTSVAEGFWPFLTREFGENVPVDVLLKVNKLYDWTSNRTNQSLSFKLDLKVEGYLHVPDGSRKLVGSAEFYGGKIITLLKINNMNITGRINYTNFESAFVETTYGIGRYESTPYTINIVVFGALAFINGRRMLGKGFSLPGNFSIMDLQDAYLGHFEDYILVGLTPFFKKARLPIP
jgi:hypothetical protein